MNALPLANPQQAHAALTSLWREQIRPALMSGQRLLLTVKPERKSRSQENLYHKRIDAIARQFVHAGCKYDSEDTKRILLQQFYTDTKTDPAFAHEWAAIGGYRTFQDEAEVELRAEVFLRF